MNSTLSIVPEGRPAIIDKPHQILHAFAFVLVLVAPTIAVDRAIGVVAGDGLLWAYRLTPAEGENPESCRIALGKAFTETQLSWAPRRSDRNIVGQIRGAAVLRKEMHVFFSDGSLRVYSLASMNGISTAQSLGNDATPLAVATDHANHTLYAIVPIDIARTAAGKEADRENRLRELRDIRPRVSPESKDDLPESDEPVSEPPLWPGATHAVVRFQTGRWIPDRPIATDWITNQTTIHLAAWKEKLHVVLSTVDTDEYRYVTSPAPDADWTTPAQLLPLAAATNVIDLLNDKEKIYAVVRTGAVRFALAELQDQKWIAGRPLTVTDQTFQPVRNDVAFAVTETKEGTRRLIGVWGDSEGFIQSTMWPITGGDAIAKVASVPQLAPGTEPIHRNWKRQFLPFVVLAIILGVLYWRRKTAVGTAIVIPPQYRLASNSRRLAAFSLDLAIGMPVIALCVSPLFQTVSDDTLHENIAILGDAYFVQTMGRLVLATGFFVLYSIIFELLWSATPGKRIMGCRVLSETGQPASKPRIVIRNLLKMLEFYPDLFPTLILVLLTKSRQRLGDLLARTIVVEPADPTINPDHIPQ